jgi:DNA-binding transcriptional LysR family regulator
MTLHAAACGLGLAIAPHFLVWEDLKEGRLVAPFGFERGRRNVVLWLAENVRQREDSRLFVGWLQRQAEASAGPA